MQDSYKRDSATRVTQRFSITSVPQFLEGAGNSVRMFVATKATRIESFKMIVDKAMSVSGNVGVNVWLGTQTSGNKFAGWITPTSASANTVYTIPLFAFDLASGDVLILKTATGRRGAGSAVFQVDLAISE